MQCIVAATSTSTVSLSATGAEVALEGTLSRAAVPSHRLFVKQASEWIVARGSWPALAL